MSPDVLFLLLATMTAAMPQPPAGRCSPVAAAALEQAAAEVARGAYADAAERLRLGYDAPAGCDTLTLAAWAARGWLAATAAADRGGTADALEPVAAAVAAVTSLGPPWSEAAYAAALLRAAAAAAQDERDEMRVWIEQARGLSVRLTLAGSAPAWPLTIDLAEGELWHGVDDYELAEAAFLKATAAHDSPAAWRGLARARDRRANKRGACEAYRQVQRLLPADATPGAAAAEARAYLLLCRP